MSGKLDMYGHWKTMSLPLAPINFDNTYIIRPCKQSWASLDKSRQVESNLDKFGQN